MPAVMLVKANDSPVPDSPGKWLAGEIVAITEQDHIYGWLEFPQNFLGEFTVSAINAIDVTNQPIYSTVKASDSGTILNTGFGDPVDVVAGDVLGLMYNDAWYGYGQKTTAAKTMYHIRVNDRTVAEVEQYLEVYNKKLEYTSDQYNPVTDMRRFTTTNIRVSATGNNGFTGSGILEAINAWNFGTVDNPGGHPDNQVTLVDTDNLTYFQCDGIMPAELFEEWQENAQQVALADYYARRRWYITSAGLSSLATQNGVIAANAADIAGFLRDGLLD